MEQAAADRAGSRFLAPVSPEVMRWKYRKLLGNLGNAVEALCGGRGLNRDAAPPAATRELAARATAEGVAVLDAAGIGYASSEELQAVRGRQVEFAPVTGTSY